MTSRYTLLTVTELEAEIAAAQCALEAKKREPDWRAIVEAFERGRHPAAGEGWVEFNKAGLIAAYPALRRAMEGDKPDDGWIKWNGGECPVAGETRVEIALRAGSRCQGRAGGYTWRSDGEGWDIIRYRVLP